MGRLRGASYHSSRGLSGARSSKFDTRDDTVGLLLNPHDSATLRTGRLRAALADGNFEFSAELYALLENDSQASSAHVERPPLQYGHWRYRNSRPLEAPPSRLQGHPRAQLVTRPTPPCGMDVTGGPLRQWRQATAVFHGQGLMIAAYSGIPHYHAAHMVPASLPLEAE